MKDIRLKTTQDYSKLIGTPYKVLDCWGLIREFYKLHDIEVHKYYVDAPNDNKIAAGYIEKYRQDFKEVFTPIYGDIIIINLLGLPSHVAVYVGNGKILHTNEKIGAMIDLLSRWDRRVVGYYRIKE